CSSDHYSIMIKIKSILAGLLLSILVPVDAGKYRKGGSVPSQNMVGGIVRRLVNRPGFPGECFICELRLPDHRF
ncbi:TPA: hypothetical protein ACV5TA_005391, partial [Escherichia coli]